MPVIKVNDQQYTLRPGQNRLGGGADADVDVGEGSALGVLAIVELADDQHAVIRRHGYDAAVRVNGVALVDPTPLLHGDKVEIAGREMFFSEDTKAGATSFVSAAEIAALAKKPAGPARATAATGGRLVSLVDGKEYTIPSSGIAIGRDASCAVVVAQNEVSRRHAEVAPVEKGYEVRDLSANGVLVNGTRVENTQILSRADVIRIGTEEFRFYADVAMPLPVVRSASSPASATSGASPRAAAVIEAGAPTDSRPIYAILEIVNEGPTKGTSFEVRVPLAHIGRGAHNDIAINDDSVSDTHAKLQYREDGWYVVDVGSTNGTYVAGQRIRAEQKLDGVPDLRFGGIKMTFRPRDSAADTNKGTRAIAQFDRSQLRPSAAPIAAPVQAPEQKGGIPGWVWGVVVLAIVAVAAFFLLNR